MERKWSMCNSSWQTVGPPCFFSLRQQKHINITNSQITNTKDQLSQSMGRQRSSYTKECSKYLPFSADLLLALWDQTLTSISEWSGRVDTHHYVTPITKWQLSDQGPVLKSQVVEEMLLEIYLGFIWICPILVCTNVLIVWWCWWL